MCLQVAWPGKRSKCSGRADGGKKRNHCLKKLRNLSAGMSDLTIKAWDPSVHVRLEVLAMTFCLPRDSKKTPRVATKSVSEAATRSLPA